MPVACRTATPDQKSTAALHEPWSYEMSLSVETIREKLKEVIDPEVGMNIIDMGLVYEIDIQDANVAIEMTLTTPGCPMSSYLKGATESALSALEGIGDIEVELVFDPPWSPEKIDP